MDPVNYYVTTLTNAFHNLAPYLAFLVGGYFVFIKMPFLFLKKSMHDQKKKLQEDSKEVVAEEKYTVEDYLAFQRKMKLLNGGKAEEKAQTEAKREAKKETRKEEPKKEKASSQKSSTNRPAGGAKKTPVTPEEVFQFRPHESFSQSELKKRYFELLKQNHPDRVASMGEDFKKLAEKNTKDINDAFEKLKKKAS